jgi:hypothetical protein
MNQIKKYIISLIFIFLSIYHPVNGQIYDIATNNNQIISTCSGTFYDSGGASSNYGDNESFSTTFCSNNSGYMQITLSNVGLSNGDILSLYNGSIVGVDYLIGQITNVNGVNYAIITSTCNCITLVFTSTSSGNRSGWIGTLSCTTPTTVQNDKILNVTSVQLDGTCLTNQTNIGATLD